jgi:exosortase B
MSTVLEGRKVGHPDRAGWWPWAAVAVGLALLYVPTYAAMARGLWRDDAYAHGPIILAVVAWLLWRRREVLLDRSLKAAPLAGAFTLLAGLALYYVGRTQSLPLFEMASHIPVLAGVVLVARGFEGARRLAFPLLFLFFAVPLPGFVIDFFTVPLKEFVSSTVAQLLAFSGYPVERAGVVLTIGEHEMLVADACSGMNSLYTLFALGFLYTHLVGPRSFARTLLVLLAVVPIAVVANMLRVIALVLVTIHVSPEAASGLFHDFAGLMVFAVAFGLLTWWEKGVRVLFRGAPDTVPEAVATQAPSSKSNLTPFLVAAGVAMVAVAVAAPVMRPVAAPAALALEQMIPATFGDWRVEPDELPVSPAPDVQANLDRLYDQVLSRTYVNSQGERMMLTVAYGGDQSDALKAHRQEACYRAQGFDIVSLAHGRYATAGREIPVTRMHAVRGDRSEPVTYWFTMGDRVVLGRLERLQVQLRHGFAGRIPDGMLVRVSSLSTDPQAAYTAHESFMSGLVGAVPPAQASRLVGTTSTQG